MDDSGIQQALARIETAARRIETAAASQPAAAPITDHDADLARRYETLRREAGAALAELDALIGQIERGATS
tara:strand:+ start:680 stop:895 length:216 start_codon:yes stop_codon:yes gene_type:complete